MISATVVKLKFCKIYKIDQKPLATHTLNESLGLIFLLFNYNSAFMSLRNLKLLFWQISVEDESAYLNASQSDEVEDARQVEDEEDEKLGFKIVRITFCKNPSTIYVRSLQLVRRHSLMMSFQTLYYSVWNPNKKFGLQPHSDQTCLKLNSYWVSEIHASSDFRRLLYSITALGQFIPGRLIHGRSLLDSS